MKLLTEPEVSMLSVWQLRYKEAEYFFDLFCQHSGPPIDNYFGMICACDAFLFTLASIYELFEDKSSERIALDESPLFQFLKACRNITAHHSILTAPVQTKFERPTPRAITDGPDVSFARLRLDITRFRAMFDEIKKDSKSNKTTVRIAEDFLKELELKGLAEIFIDNVFRDGLKDVWDRLAALEITGV